MRDPYGAQAAPLYGLTDPQARGELQLAPDKVRTMWSELRGRLCPRPHRPGERDHFYSFLPAALPSGDETLSQK